MRVLIAFFAMIVITSSCYEPINKVTSYLEISVRSRKIDTILVADGVTALPIDFQIKGSENLINRDINVTTTLGTFENDTKTIVTKTDSSGKARVFLKGSTAGTARVQATLANFSFFKEFKLERAAPDLIILNTDVFQTSAGADKLLTINALLTRSIGKVSSGYVLQFSASTNQEFTNPIGVFTSSIPSSDSGVTSVKFAIPNSAFIGTVYFRATLIDKTSPTYGPVVYK